MSTLPSATFAVNGFDYTGIVVYSAKAGEGYVPVYLSDHRTGEIRFVPLDFALSHTL